MCNIFLCNISMVLMKEMSNVFLVECKGVNVLRGDWVRLKRLSYKGDFVKVVDIDDVRYKVIVKVIFRISLLFMFDRLVWVYFKNCYWNVLK